MYSTLLTPLDFSSSTQSTGKMLFSWPFTYTPFQKYPIYTSKTADIYTKSHPLSVLTFRKRNLPAPRRNERGQSRQKILYPQIERRRRIFGRIALGVIAAAITATSFSHGERMGRERAQGKEIGEN
jgi:hypothetical protein